MKKNTHTIYGPVLLLLLCISSCGTLPPEKPASVWIGMFPDQSSLYICINEPEKIQPLLYDILPIAGLSMPSVDTILLKTNKVYASVSIREGTPPLFSIALTGRYASLCLGVGLNVSRKWEKDPQTGRFWKYKKTHVMVAQPGAAYLLITNHDMVSFLHSFDSPRANILPDNVLDSLEQGVCTLFFPRFGDEVIPERIPINKKKLSVQEVVLSTETDPDSGMYSVKSSFNLITTDKARLFTTTFKTFIIWLMRHAAITDFTRRIKVTTTQHLVHTTAKDFTHEEIVQALKVLLSADKIL